MAEHTHHNIMLSFDPFADIAPECLDMVPGTPLTDKVDMYSFGVLLREMLARMPPWPGMSPLQVAAAVALHGLRPHWELSHSTVAHRVTQLVGNGVHYDVVDVHQFADGAAARLPAHTPVRLLKLASACLERDPGLRPSAAEASKVLRLLMRQHAAAVPTTDADATDSGIQRPHSGTPGRAGSLRLDSSQDTAFTTSSSRTPQLSTRATSNSDIGLDFPGDF